MATLVGLRHPVTITVKDLTSSSSSIYFTNDLKHNCFYVDISIEIIVVTLGMYVIWGCIVLTAYALLS